MLDIPRPALPGTERHCLLLTEERNGHGILTVVQRQWVELQCPKITGFIQPAYVVKLLSQDDFDGFNDRQLYVCPVERDVDYDKLVPFDPTTKPQVKRVYDIIGNFHKASVTYKMDTNCLKTITTNSNEENFLL